MFTLVSSEMDVLLTAKCSVHSSHHWSSSFITSQTGESFRGKRRSSRKQDSNTHPSKHQTFNHWLHWAVWFQFHFDDSSPLTRLLDSQPLYLNLNVFDFTRLLHFTTLTQWNNEFAFDPAASHCWVWERAHGSYNQTWICADISTLSRLTAVCTAASTRSNM